MSGRVPSAKNKRPERESSASDSRSESQKSKHDLRSDYYGSGFSPSGKSKSGADRSPSFRGDRRRGDRGRERDDRSGGIRRDDRGFGRSYNSRADMRLSQSESGDDRGDDYRKHDGKAFADDSRLSKLVRKISREDDRDRRINVAKQLKEYLVQPENVKTITKVSDNLLMALQDVFYERTYKDVKLEMASCIGLVGYTLGQEAQRYVEWLFTNLSAAQQDDVKILLLTAMLETLKHDESTQNLLDIMPMVMTNCQGVLESADHPDLLVAVVDIILYVITDHPHVFASHFRDSVDILVGWHIDATQKEALTNYTADALVSFHTFWVSDMNFSVTLLGQFLEDMEAYAEDLSLGLSGQTTDEDMPSPDECITKISALLRVFTTVMRSLREYFMPDKGPAVTIEFMVEIVERTLRCIDGVLKVMYCEKVYMAANKCMHLLCTNLGGEVTRVCDVVTEYLVHQSHNTRIASSRYLLSFLHLTQKVIEQMTTKLPVPVLTQLLSPDSLVHKLRKTQNTEVLKELMNLHHVILSVKSVPLIEEAYRFMLADMEVAFNRLLENMESDVHCSLVRANPFSEVTYTVKQAEATIIYDICALAEVGNTKNNVIGMWALSPSLFALLASHLLPLDRSLMERYPAVQYALLQTLFSHCSRHGHFISSSHLITRNTILEGTLLANVSPATSAHFTTVLSLLEDLLSGQMTSYDSRLLALKWTQDIIDALQTSQHIYKTEEFHELINALIIAGFSCHDELSLIACQCLQNLLNHTTKMDIAVLKRCHDLCSVRLCHTNRKARTAYQSLLNSLPLEVTTTNHEYGPEGQPASKRTGTLVTSSRAVWLARRSHMGRVPMGTFHSHNFRAVLGYLLHGTTPNKAGGIAWLDQMYLSSQRADKDNQHVDSQNDLSNLISDNEALLWFWVTWETAQFCILSKLRTPLGKPQETFTAIEAAIKQFATEARSMGTDMEGVGGGHDWAGVTPETGTVEAQRVHLLLQFMEHLEKQLYNAYEGCAVAIVSPPKMVRTFFRTNRGTCQEWLGRVRLGLVTVARHCGEWAVVVRHTFEMLQEMKDNNKTQTAEFEVTLVSCVEALSNLRCPEALLGIYAWCKEILGRKLAWIKAASEIASGRYESATTDLKSSLRHYISPDPQLEETRELGSTPGSQSSTPSGSPKHSTDGLQRLSLLSRQSEHTGPLNGKAGDNAEGPEASVVNYMVSQVSLSYEKMCQWEDVLAWQETIKQYRSEHSGTPLQNAFSLNTDINFIQALSRFDGLDIDGTKECLELVPGGSLADLGEDTPHPSVVWAPAAVLDFTTKQHLRAVTAALLGHLTNHSESVLDSLDVCQRWCEGIQRVTALQWPAHVHSEASLQLYTLSLCKNQVAHYAGVIKGSKPKRLMYPMCDEMTLDPQQHDLGAALQALSCIDVQQQLQETLLAEHDKAVDFWPLTSKLRISAVSLARKQQNLNVAENLLVDEMFASIGMKSESERQSESGDSLFEVLVKLQNSRENLTQIHAIRLEREGSKLLRSKGPSHIAIETMCTTVLHHCQTIATLSPTQNRDVINVCSDLNARSLLSLVQWLQTDYKYLTSLTARLKLLGQQDEPPASHVVHEVAALLQLEKRGKLKPRLPKAGEEEDDDMDKLNITDNPILGESDTVVGQLYHLATLQAPELAKAWFAFAGWCYKWGRKAVDHATHGSVELSTDEKAQILDLLPKGISNEETESALTILSQIHTGSSSEEDISDQDQMLYDDGAETTRRQLLSSCMSLQIASDECVDRLIELWRGVVQRVYQYYQLSAKAYFTYLKLNGQSNQETNMDGNITATLRVLRLLVKHAWELRGVLEDGLAHTPTAPWKGIIPQLFSRLNHPEPYVRQSVSDLLCRVAQDAPHLIVYPAVVGCSSAKIKDADRDGLLNEYLSQPDDEAEVDPEDPQSQNAADDDAPVDDSNTAFLENCFTTIVDTLANTNPSMISEVQLLVSELRRITLLWDELWLGTLNQHHGDVSRRLQQLDNEVKKVNNNSTLSKEEKAAIIREKHKTVIKPTLYTMERLWEITSQPAETAHEHWFQETYGQLIQDGLAKLREPTDPGHPALTWQHFKQLHHSLQQRAQKRTSLVLNMEEISSKLANLKNTVIAMPGVSSSSGQVVTIDAIHHTVQILPTKTKPKKLVFMGSDGKKYAYLFKGLEDLHLDERIMQFLAIVNNMFAKANRNNSRLYHARHYSVTPLGARSGLIQWVDGATPLFSLYKRWQQREATALQLKQQTASQATAAQPTIARPSEVFYSKLTPALKEKGLVNMDNRKDWPLSIMKKVLDDLVAETPRDLLAKELWCSATSAREWWQITQTYCRSTAVMSMIGYIIGLGDRHLDNVLVDLATGEVVHIDYNVCFEKGKSLRVPEKVPFRMTQNLEAALGVTGIEGIFRGCCEYVIRTMRKGRETLLTLLEAFVYDPLVDWTTGNEGGYTGAFYGGGHTGNTAAGGQQSKRDMEREITLSMFSIRMAEMKTSWIQNRDSMLASLPKLETSVQGHLDTLQTLQGAETQVDKLLEQQRYLQEALDDPEHVIYTLTKRYKEYEVVTSTKTGALEAVQEKMNDSEQWHKAHQYAMDAIKHDKLQKMCADISKPVSVSLSCFDIVTDFLNGAGQSQLVSQCEGASSELSTSVHQRRVFLRSCLDILHRYATIVANFPSSFVEDSRTTRWQLWLQELVCAFTVDKCKQIEQLMEQQFGSTLHSASRLQEVLNTDNKLESVLGDITDKFMALVQRRSHEGADTSILTSHVQEGSSAIHNFMTDNGAKGTMCMTSVVVTALCSLSKRYLIMEGAAAGAGDRLMDLTSREGDWFLDELCSMSGNVNQLLGLLNDPTLTQLLSADTCQQITQSIQSVHTVYMALQDLNVNFRTIILPEAVKTLQAEEPSVLVTMAALEELVQLCGQPLDSVIEQLELQLVNAIMGMLSSDSTTLTVVKQIRQQFDRLLSGPDPDSTSDLSPGQMLLMGFNGLFTQLDSDFDAMLEATGRIQAPEAWRKVDVVKEAKSIQLTAFNDSTIGLLSNLFFVKQLKAMTSFFRMAQELVRAIQDCNHSSVHDEDFLTRPIKLFIAEYVRKHMIGLPSQTLGYILCHYINALHVDVTAEIELRDIGAASKVSLEDLCKKAVDLSVKNNSFDSVHLTQASSLVATNDLAWRKADLAVRLDQNIHLLDVSRQRAQLQLARFQWLNEDCLSQAGRAITQLTAPVRATVMSELRKSIQALVHQEAMVTGKQEQHLQLEGSVMQRLKWAAGANPSLSMVLQQFDECLGAKNGFVQTEGLLAGEVVTIGNAVLHFEALRTDTAEAMAADTAFLTLLSRCEEACAIVEACKVSVSDVEQSLVQAKPLAEAEEINEDWINSRQADLALEITAQNAAQEELNKNVDLSKDGVLAMVGEIRGVLTTHHKLMSDIRTILKSMAKQEEQDYGTEMVPGGIREYVQAYKAFSEKFTTMMKLVMVEELTPAVGREIEAMIATLAEQIVSIYEHLMTFAPPLTYEQGPDTVPTALQHSFATAVKRSEVSPAVASPKRLPLSAISKPDLLTGTSSGAQSPQTTGPVGIVSKTITMTAKKPDKVARDPRTGKAIQERNSYAVGVWRRVKTKLDGRDPDLNKRLSVAEQVEYVIKEAISPENLAMLYEGWTPWV